MCFFLNKKVHLLVSKLYLYQNARCNNKKLVQLVEKSGAVLKNNASELVVEYSEGKRPLTKSGCRWLQRT